MLIIKKKKGSRSACLHIIIYFFGNRVCVHTLGKRYCNNAENDWNKSDAITILIDFPVCREIEYKIMVVGASRSVVECGEVGGGGGNGKLCG